MPARNHAHLHALLKAFRDDRRLHRVRPAVPARGAFQDIKTVCLAAHPIQPWSEETEQVTIILAAAICFFRIVKFPVSLCAYAPSRFLEAAYYYYFSLDDRFPVRMELSLLVGAGEPFVSRAAELADLFAHWRATQEEKFYQYPQYLSYLERFERFTPIVILPVPDYFGPEDVPELLSDVNLGAAALARRLVITRVKGGDGQRPLTAGWPLEWTGKDFYSPTLNSSPINASRFDGLMRHVRRVFRSRVDSWYFAEKRRARVSQLNLPYTETPATTHAGKPDVFISYSRKDQNTVAPICDQLHKMGRKLWFDQTSIEGGEDFIDRIVEGIDGSSIVLPFCSKHHSASSWCWGEVFYARKYAKRLVPIWLSDPALFGKMDFVLGPLNATVVEGLAPHDAAKKIISHL